MWMIPKTMFKVWRKIVACPKLQKPGSEIKVLSKFLSSILVLELSFEEDQAI